MQADSKVKRKESEKQRSLSTGDLQESSNITLEELQSFPEPLSDRGSSLYVPLQKLPKTKEKNYVKILRQRIESMDKKLETLLDEVKKNKQIVEKQNPFSKTLRLGKKTMTWRRREKRRQEQQKSLAKTYVNQCKGETANLCLRFLLMLMNVADETSKNSTMKKTTTLKPVLMCLSYARKNSFSRDILERINAKPAMKDENGETILDSFMYRSYHNGFTAATRTAELRPLIPTSRNIDEYVSRELHSTLPTHHSEGASDLTSNESRTSEGPHSMNLELIRLVTYKNFPAYRVISTIKLAREGFYYSGHDDRVICFACGFEKSVWRVNDDPGEIHRQGSPECSFINSQSVNIRVGENLNCLNRSKNHKYSEKVYQQNATNLLFTEDEAQSQGTEQFPSSSLPTIHSEGASGSTSNESRSSERPHSMNLELIRLGTFQNFPAYRVISTIKLAREGFYYSGHDDRVICFACGFEKSGWRVNDDPGEIHRQGSPECSLMNEQSDMFE